MRRCLLFVLLLVLLSPATTVAYAAEPVYSLDVSLNKLNCAIGEAVDVTVTVSWQFSPVNVSAELKLFRSDGTLVAVLKQFTITGENGTFT